MPPSSRTVARPRPGARRTRPLLLVATVACLLLGLLGVPSQAVAGSARTSLTVSSAVARAGEMVTLRGRVPTVTARLVVLERRTTKRWVRVDRARTSRTGAFRFRVAARAEQTRYRVRAARAGRLPVAITPSRTVTPLVPPVIETPTPTTPPVPGVPGVPGVPPGPSPAPSGGSIAVRADASSAAPGSAPAQALDPSAPGWRSRDGETVGAWIELGWDTPAVVRRLVVERPALGEPGVTAGFLTFDDGSHLQVALSPTSPVTVLPVSPRSTTGVRFTVTAVEAGATSAALRSVLVQAGPAIEGVDVSTAAGPDGDAAPLAVPSAGSGDPAALVDGRAGDPGATWSSASPTGSSFRLDWAAPRELTSLSVAGTGSRALLAAATVRFSDGSLLPLGAVTADTARPTVLAFMPRVTSWVEIRVDKVTGSGPLGLAEVSALQRGAAPATAPGGPQAAFTDRPVDCSRTSRPTDATGLVVTCPTAGSQVGARASVAVALGPSYTSVSATVWPASGTQAPSTTLTRTADQRGLATFDLDVSALPAGPFTVSLVATGPGMTARKAFLGLQRHGGATDTSTSPVGPVGGRSLVWSEEFDRPLVLSRTGEAADYSSSKPERTYGADFGDAIFADPSYGLGNVRTVDDRYLKISTQPNPPGFSDPQRWNRTRVGGMLASARPGGSGFSAQYAYFEARMLLPAGIGTWPAFWMLPSNNLVVDLPVVAEIDALEHYGENLQGACHTSHQYPDPDRVGVALCTHRRWATEREALTWHTFGVSVEPTRIRYFIDGVETGSAAQVAGGGDPMFWLVDLSLGGGWPIDLSPTQDRHDLYVDYVRVYV